LNLNFPHCEINIFTTSFSSLTRYKDGATVVSAKFENTVGLTYGYAVPERFNAEHDLLHHFVADQLGTYSHNHWLIAHGMDAGCNEHHRNLEEMVVAGFTFLVHPDRFHFNGAWTNVPEIYIAYAESVFAAKGVEITPAVTEYQALQKRIWG
jgi:hypothetical protein